MVCANVQINNLFKAIIFFEIGFIKTTSDTKTRRRSEPSKSSKVLKNYSDNSSLFASPNKCLLLSVNCTSTLKYEQ